MASPVHNPNEAAYWDKQDLLAEERRQLDVCHGCRLCWNLCPSFPALFDKTDAVDGDMSKLETADFEEVERWCFQCKLCWVVCPYTEPHEYALDIPRLFMRTKFNRTQREGVGLGGKLLGDQDRLGKMGSMTAPMTNLANRLGPTRRIIEMAVGVHRNARLPEFHGETLGAWFSKKYGNSIKPAGEPTRKVAFFATCTVNYNEPQIGKAAIRVLEHNNVEVVVPEQQCCGMPMVDVGDMKGTRRKVDYNLPRLAALVDQGYDIVTTAPTCTYMLREEYPEIADPQAAEMAKRVAEHTFEFGHYLVGMARDKVLERDFQRGLGKIAFHAACHTRAQAVGNNSARLLGILPDTEVAVVEQCSGHDGTWGVSKEYHELSLQIGKKLFDGLTAGEPTIFVSDCPQAQLQVEHGTGQRPIHTAQALAVAYGLATD